MAAHCLSFRSSSWHFTDSLSLFWLWFRGDSLTIQFHFRHRSLMRYLSGGIPLPTTTHGSHTATRFFSLHIHQGSKIIRSPPMSVYLWILDLQLVPKLWMEPLPSVFIVFTANYDCSCCFSSHLRLITFMIFTHLEPHLQNTLTQLLSHVGNPGGWWCCVPLQCTALPSSPYSIQEMR